MPITASDVQSPAGDIDGGIWFPTVVGGALTTLLNGYIADAYTKTADDAAAELWVYYRAATAVADRMTASPASWTGTLVDQGGGGETTLQNQIQHWLDKAAAYLLAFNNAVADVTDDPLGGFAVLTSLRHG